MRKKGEEKGDIPNFRPPGPTIRSIAAPKNKNVPFLRRGED